MKTDTLSPPLSPAFISRIAPRPSSRYGTEWAATLTVIPDCGSRIGIRGELEFKICSYDPSQGTSRLYFEPRAPYVEVYFFPRASRDDVSGCALIARIYEPGSPRGEEYYSAGSLGPGGVIELGVSPGGAQISAGLLIAEIVGQLQQRDLLAAGERIVNSRVGQNEFHDRYSAVGSQALRYVIPLRTK